MSTDRYPSWARGGWPECCATRPCDQLQGGAAVDAPIGIAAPLSPKPRTTKPTPGHDVYPFLLRDLAINRPNEVWAADITYIRSAGAFPYLVAVKFGIAQWVAFYNTRRPHMALDHRTRGRCRAKAPARLWT